MTGSADLLLYGCDIAAGDGGRQFIAQLARATGADVAASLDDTGTARLAGNWLLEAAAGAIETPSLSQWHADAGAKHRYLRDHGR